ncbi:MAG TPA: SUMF1/EgtB/PvdO family nonheme iron enzyme, partial [Pirellulales bacterium]|nr:SUMF1/EgtB/PvdO family nonheme iron enzyme [Pirellulales bacterium]
ALAAGRKAKDTALIKRVVEVGKTVTAAKQQWDGFHKAQATLAKTPDDPAANLAVGRYLALVQGDWEQGLVHLAKGPDGPLKDLAVKGLKPPSEPAALAEMGDAWFNASDKAKGKDKVELRAGAAYWYSLAEPGLTGLAKTIVEKRLKELGGKVAVAQPSSGGKMPETIELPLAPGVGMKFRLIPAGTFTMGTPGNASETPHRVDITKPFYLGATEVTQAQWLAVMGSNPSAFPGELERPVEKVSWNDCQVFLERLNSSAAARKLRFRLPTEAEWEYACRAGTTTKYYFGDDVALLLQNAWFKDNSNGTPHPVGQLKPNPWGLYDMYGNVYDWCSDWFAKDYYQNSPAADPEGPPSGMHRVLRGGAFSNLPEPCRSGGRNARAPDVADNPYGLRVVCEPKVKAAATTRRASKGVAAPIDVLKLIDLQRDVVSGSGWKLRDGTLILPAAPASGAAPRLMLSAPPWEEYSLHMAVRPTGNNCGLFVGLVIGGARCGLYCEPAYTALGMVDGVHPNSSPTKSKAIWDGEKPVDLVCDVRAGGVTVRAIGQPILTWAGDPQRLSMHGAWTVPNPRALIIGPRGAACEITRLELTTIGADTGVGMHNTGLPARSGAKRPLAFSQAEVERSVANWVLSLGGKVKVTSPAELTPTSDPPEITSADQLPAEPFVVFGIDLSEKKSVTDSDLARTAGLANLVELKLHGTATGDAGMAYIGQIPRLKLLYLHNTKVTDAGLSELDQLTNLTHLFLTGTRTTDAGFVHLRQLTAMRHLGLQNTGLTDAGMKNLAAMPHLRWLAISRTTITDLALKELTRNLEITDVELVRTKISDAGLMQVRSMPMLSGLNLDQTAISDRGLEVLATIPGLKSVHLTGSKVTDDGVQKFRARRPDCEITR